MREMSKSAETDLTLVTVLRKEKGRSAEIAFEKIYKKYHDPLLFQFGGLIKDKEDAKELILDAFCKLNVNKNIHEYLNRYFINKSVKFKESKMAKIVGLPTTMTFVFSKNWLKN